MMKKIVIVLFSCLLLSCNQKNEIATDKNKMVEKKIQEENVDLEELFKIANKINSGLNIGISFVDYSGEIDEFASELDFLKAKLVTERSKTLLLSYKQLLEIYLDAKYIWDKEITSSNYFQGKKGFLLKSVSYKKNEENRSERNYDLDTMKSYIEKYNLDIYEEKQYIEATGYTIIDSILFSKDSLIKIWSNADIVFENIKNDLFG